MAPFQRLQPINIATWRQMVDHLDTWAAEHLTSPQAWADALNDTRDWLDLSPRNELLLASYGARGPAAGVETWRLVPSTRDGRMCNVRAGEHGLPIRVPITTTGPEPDPYLGGRRPTRAAVESWEWRPVFCAEQLATRPAPGALQPAAVPTGLTGADGAARFGEAAAAAATRTTKRVLRADGHDPIDLIAAAAKRRTAKPDQTPLHPILARQAALLVADRVGHASDPLPDWDPARLAPTDRWGRLLDVLDASRALTQALAVEIGVDLCASPLPRMIIEDDRVTPAGRRHQLPPASLAQLPPHRWITVGPYTSDEWGARGVPDAKGTGSYMRLDDHTYLFAYEQGLDGAWRLEDTTPGPGGGTLDHGTATDISEARATAAHTIRDRYLKHAIDPAPDHDDPPPAGTRDEWRPFTSEQGKPATKRVLANGVTLCVFDRGGGHWLPLVFTRSRVSEVTAPGATHRSLAAAKDAAELMGRRASRQLDAATPVGCDQAIASLAASDDYSRQELAVLTEQTLGRPSQCVPDAEPHELAGLLADAGCTPPTIVHVLAADGVTADQAAAIMPTLSVPNHEALNHLAQHWQLPPPAAAELIGASATDMRDAGCTAAEILAVRPTQVLAALDEDPTTWEIAAGDMKLAGHTPARIVSHLRQHAPTPAAFAAGVDAACPHNEAIPLAVAYGAQGPHLAALTERLGLSPNATADELLTSGAPQQVAIECLLERTDSDIATTAQLARDILHLRPRQILDCLERAPGSPLPDHPLATLFPASHHTDNDLTGTNAELVEAITGAAGHAAPLAVVAAPHQEL